MYGVIFLIGKKLGRELQILGREKGRICLWTVLGAFGGILLWVHGSSAPWVFRAGLMPQGVPGFTLFFLLWVTAYALAGCELGIQLLPVCFRCRTGLRESLFCVLAYTLALAWYPLFFSVLHGFLSILVLTAAILLHFLLLIGSFRRFFAASVPYFFSCLLEIYFLCVTIEFLLVN